MNLAPIALFVYNRLQHTKQTVEALKKNNLANDSELFVFSDGARLFQGPEERAKVQKIRSYIKQVSGFKNVTLIERNENQGLAKNIISGVTEIVNKYGKVIIMEDDLVTSPHFLTYMNDGLDTYENEDKVISIHGYVYPTKKELPETFFLKGADCWGWATWKRGWDLFEPNGQKLLNEIRKRNLAKEFNFNNNQSFLSMLKKQITGKNDSWAVRWHASAFLKNKLTLYPGRSLIKNIGLDSSGFHSGKTDVFDVELSPAPISVRPIPIKENIEARKTFVIFFKLMRPGLIQKVKNKSKKIKKYIKLFIPPILLNIYLGRKNKKYGFFGIYENWTDAKKASVGYDSDKIIEKVKDSALKVKRGEAAYERDSVAYEKIEYSWHLLAPLLWIGSQNNNRLNVLDFGGALGTTYFQNKSYLSHLNDLKWNIVEQEKFVKIGKESLEDSELRFYNSIDESLSENNSDVIILSSSLQYIEEPYQILQKIIKEKPKYILFDKTPFHDGGNDLITVQKVPKHIYDASYPAWILSKSKFLSFFKKNNYEIIADFNKYQKDIFNLPGIVVTWSGFLLKLR